MNRNVFTEALSSAFIPLCTLLRMSPKIASTEATTSHSSPSPTSNIEDLILHRLALEVEILIVRLHSLFSPLAASPTIDLAFLAFSTTPRIATTHSTSTVFPPTSPPLLHTSPRLSPPRATPRSAPAPPTQTRPHSPPPPETASTDAPPPETPSPPLPQPPGVVPAGRPSLLLAASSASIIAPPEPSSRLAAPAPATARPTDSSSLPQAAYLAVMDDSAGRRVDTTESVSVTSW